MYNKNEGMAVYPVRLDDEAMAELNTLKECGELDENDIDRDIYESLVLLVNEEK